MGRFAQEAAAHHKALVALRDELIKFKEALTPLDAVLANTAVELNVASNAVQALAEGTAGSNAIADRLCSAASSLGGLQAQHDRVKDHLASVRGNGRAGGQLDGEGADRRSKSRDLQAKLKRRVPFDFSAFTRARWEAERLKGISMIGASSEGGESAESGSSGIKIFMTDLPKPFQPEKPCTQVKGRHIVVSTAEKVRKAYIEISISGTHDRVGFIRGANLARFASLAMERSDCPITAKKGGDMGWIAKGKGDARVEEVAMVTPRGACSPPFKVGNSFHLFFCEDRKG